jgi:hypothetical protein
MNIGRLNDIIPITDLLAKEGILPAQKRDNDWWYISPIRAHERTASFKVDIVINRWYDHGTGEGGKLFDLALRLYPTLNSSQVFKKLKDNFSFQQPEMPSIQPQKSASNALAGHERLAGEKKKIQVLSTGPISSPALIHYLGQRKIPVELAQIYCREVQYALYDKQYYAIGFSNNAGGYELRNPYFKGSSSPKGISFFDKGSRQVAVFEGFFNFLSFLTLHQNQALPCSNFLVLNSLSFFEKSRTLMEKHGTINLYLDRDAAGMKHTAQAIKASSQYKDNSTLYQDHEDLNQWLIQNFQQIQRNTQSISRENNIEEDIQNKQVVRNRGRHI